MNMCNAMHDVSYSSIYANAWTIGNRIIVCLYFGHPYTAQLLVIGMVSLHRRTWAAMQFQTCYIQKHLRSHQCNIHSYTILVWSRIPLCKKKEKQNYYVCSMFISAFFSTQRCAVVVVVSNECLTRCNLHFVDRFGVRCQFSLRVELAKNRKERQDKARHNLQINYTISNECNNLFQ